MNRTVILTRAVDQASCAPARASSFFIALRSVSHGLVVCEPQDHRRTHAGVYFFRNLQPRTPAAGRRFAT